MERHEFHAMGTTVECLLDGDPRDGFARVEAEFERLEALLSRFRPDSELSRLNRDGSLEAGPDLLRVTALALEARERSGGLFDPTVLDAVVAAGYDRSFELVPADGPAASGGARCGGGIRDRRATGSSSSRGRTSTSAGSPRATPSTAPSSCSRPTARASSTRAATSPSAAAPGRSASTARSRSSSPAARSPRRAATGGAGAAAARSSTT